MSDFVDKLYAMTTEELETFLKKESQKIIEACGNEENKRKLGQLQWKMDCLRKNYTDPVQRMELFNKMMIESATTMAKHLEKAKDLLNEARNEQDNTTN